MGSPVHFTACESRSSKQAFARDAIVSLVPECNSAGSESEPVRIALLAWHDVSFEGGPLKRMIAQCQAWRALGHQSKLFTMGAAKDVWKGLDVIEHENVCSGGAFVRLSRVTRILNSVSAWRPDIIFFRLNGYYPAMERLMKQIPFVVEVNSDDRIRVSQKNSRLIGIYHAFTRRRLLRRAAAINCVTRELETRIVPPGKPSLAIPNGIHLENYAWLPPAQNQHPNLVFIGSPQNAWHGIDKIVELAKSNSDWHFDVVGMSEREATDGSPNNVQFHGYLPASDYKSILENSDVALGTLALDRAGIHEACPLKVREYLAHGIPTIIGYRDADFPVPPEFLLELPGNEGSITRSLDRIRDFVEQWKGRRVERGWVSNLELIDKERERVEFFKKTISDFRAW